MNPEEMEELRRAIAAASAALFRFANQTRWCQRCEEKRIRADFTSILPVCDHCVATMPEQELRELAESLR